MAYSLSFSESFYLDADPVTVAPSNRPTSVYQAILSIRAEKWDEIAREVFGVRPEQLDSLTVLERIRQTDTCSNLDSPVQVWIDQEGWFDVLVFDRPEASSRTVGVR